MKLSPPYQAGRVTGVHLDGAHFSSSAIPLRNLIYSAYGVASWRLAGGPAWLDEAYDIAATLPPNTSPAQINSMVQALLADRFHLSVHHETKDASVLETVVGEHGSKLTVSREDSKFSVKTGKGHLELRRASLPAFVSYLSSALGLPVIDKTELKGLFDITLDWAPDSVTSSENPGPSIFASIQELGLRLESRRSPIDFIVIDHVERPAEN